MSELRVDTIKKADGTGSLSVPAESGTVVVKDGSNDVTLNNITATGVYLGGTGAANYLDDYEEGTFTPAWSTGTATYTFQLGRYVKVGNVVHYQINLRSSSVSSMTLANITGLPFTSQNVATEFATGSTFPVQGFENLGSAGIASQVAINSTTLAFYIVSQSSGNNYASLTASALNEGSGVEIAACGFYYVA